MTYTEEEYDRVAQHIHCRMCGKAIPPEEEVCSDACQERMELLLKKRRTYNYFMIGSVLFVLLLIMLNASFQ